MIEDISKFLWHKSTEKIIKKINWNIKNFWKSRKYKNQELIDELFIWLREYSGNWNFFMLFIDKDDSKEFMKNFDYNFLWYHKYPIFVSTIKWSIIQWFKHYLYCIKSEPIINILLRKIHLPVFKSTYYYYYIYKSKLKIENNDEVKIEVINNFLQIINNNYKLKEYKISFWIPYFEMIKKCSCDNIFSADEKWINKETIIELYSELYELHKLTKI